MLELAVSGKEEVGSPGKGQQFNYQQALQKNRGTMAVL